MVVSFLAICQPSFSDALDQVAGLIRDIGVDYCLDNSLRSCDSDSDCPETEKSGQATCRSYWNSTWELGRGQCLTATGEILLQPNGCTADGDCATNAHCDRRSICRWDAAHGGDPADMQVLVRRNGAPEGTELNSANDGDFLPTDRFGCLDFAPAAEPGPDDFVEMRYVSEVAF